MIPLIVIAAFSVGMWLGIWVGQWEHRGAGMPHHWTCPSVACTFEVHASEPHLLERVKRSHLDAVHQMEGL